MDADYFPVCNSGSARTIVPGLKRGKYETAVADRVKLENVYGLTVTSNAALDCNPSTELIAYPAGCTVVLYNPRKNRQTHILNASRKSITCVAFSRCGRYLATGECGLAPCVRVWDMQDPTSISAVQVAEFSGHKHGVGFLVFSTSSKYLVSVGSQHDMIVNVWDWKSNLKFASNKVSSRVKAVSFSENGNYFVTVGFRHVKFWYLDYSRNAKYKEPVPLMGRSAILGEQKDNEFCDVVCGRDSSADSTFALTRSGLLCEFNSKRLLEKWVGLRTASANCMAIGSNYIFVGCAEGIVRCFSPKTLEYITTLPQSHYLGVDVSQGYNISHIRYSKPEDARYPDAIALTYDDTNFKLTCVYNDHSLFVWDVRDIKRVGKSHSALYHSACIWGLDMVSTEEPLPPGCFLTCSSDDTIRFWQTNPSTTNIYSTELTKILYIDPELKFIKDADLTSTNDKEKSKSYDDKTGVRCVRVSHDGEHIASGDRAGNIRIYATATHFIVRTLEAHDAEVLCLEYSDNPKLLASASRDRLIHVFQVDKNYELLQTLDDHSSSITAVRFIRTSTGLQMVSCGADKSILFRQMVTENGTYQFTRYMNVSGRCTLYDMEVDIGGRHIMTACQDRNVRVYSTAQGKHTKTFRGTIAEDGTLIKVALDSSGIYLATSSTDKILSIYDYYSGECMATMCGHSEIVTGLRFTPDCQHLISASGDGCIFVWRVPHDMVVTMRARLAQQRKRKGNAVDGISGSESDSLPQDTSDKFVTPIVPDYTLNIGRLPSWAIKSLGNVVPPNNTPAPEPPSRGKWAARINLSEISVKRTDSDGSKESSLDSGTDTQYVDKKREHTAKQDHESTEHDGDVEDISDGERTSSFARGYRKTYYPGNNDDDTASKFMVTSMDVDDLRQSLQRSKRRKNDPPKIEVTDHDVSHSGSPQDSDEDEDISTPSCDNGDPNPLSGSCESLDIDKQREKCLKSVFDSLSGAEVEDPTVAGTTSLSSQHLSRTPSRFASAPLPAPRFTAIDPESARKREELNRRIRETKRQLESVGVNSNLKSSQSTHDLTFIGRNEARGRPRSQHVNKSSVNCNSSKYNNMESRGDGEMRRAISLSDLAVKPTPAPRRPVTSKPGTNKSSTFRRPLSTTNLDVIHNSAGVINDPVRVSDSEDDHHIPRRGYNIGGRNQSLMRPTISSMNKAAATVVRRRGIVSAASSTVNLSSGVHEGSSSEAEEHNIRANTALNKPAVPARPRNVKMGRSGSSRDLSTKVHDVTAKQKLNNSDCQDQESEISLEITTSNSTILCHELAEQLTKVAAKIVRLYRKLQDPDATLTKDDNSSLLSGLELAMRETQKVLEDTVPKQDGNNANDGNDTLSSLSSDDGDFSKNVLSADNARLKLEQLVNKEGACSTDETMTSIEQYSDILLNIMQNKIVNQYPESSQSLPPNTNDNARQS